MFETMVRLSSHYKFNQAERARRLKAIVADLFILQKNPAYNLRKLLARGISDHVRPEEAIGDLAETLHYGELKESVTEVLDRVNAHIYLLIDNLDEGYVPDAIGVAYIAGIVQGTINLKHAFARLRPVLFIRDNMFRALSEQDPDYSRNIEGSVLRLHWTEHQLLNLATKRICAAFDIKQGNDIKIWNSVAAKGLIGRDGFRKCLRMTLYRPRDLLALLNEAFFSASRDNRSSIIENDIDSSAKEISQTCLDDLQKEYSAIFPAIKVLTRAFANNKPEMAVAEVEGILNQVLRRDDYEPAIQQDIVMFDGPREAIRELYSVGFLGIQEDTSGSFNFCHDGRSPDIAVEADSRLLVHPCYQLALNVTKGEVSLECAQEIHDDYEIEVVSVSQEQRGAFSGWGRL